nr:MAG TPA: hypothetical protein [Caudoviricetes sp.]
MQCTSLFRAGETGLHQLHAPAFQIGDQEQSGGFLAFSVHGMIEHSQLSRLGLGGDAEGEVPAGDIGFQVHVGSSVIQISETVKVKQMPRSVLSVCTVSHWQNRKDSACRMVELRTTRGVGNSSATEAFSRFSWGGWSSKRTLGTRRSIFPAASRTALYRFMAEGFMIFIVKISFRCVIPFLRKNYRRFCMECRVKKGRNFFQNGNRSPLFRYEYGLD